MRLLSLIAGWVLVVAATTAITWQIVGAADAQVSQQPASPLNIAAPEFNTSPTPENTVTTVTTTTADPITTASDLPGPTDEESATTTTLAATDTSTTTTTAPPAPTTTEEAWSLTNYSSAGGVVVFAYRPGEVRLQAATPAPGFQTEVEQYGPTKVEVEFESASLKVEVSAEWHDGSLEIEESSEEAESGS